MSRPDDAGRDHQRRREELARRERARRERDAAAVSRARYGAVGARAAALLDAVVPTLTLERAVCAAGMHVAHAWTDGAVLREVLSYQPDEPVPAELIARAHELCTNPDEAPQLMRRPLIALLLRQDLRATRLRLRLWASGLPQAMAQMTTFDLGKWEHRDVLDWQPYLRWQYRYLREHGLSHEEAENRALIVPLADIAEAFEEGLWQDPDLTG